jgi:hypothetical protein
MSDNKRLLNDPALGAPKQCHRFLWWPRHQWKAVTGTQKESAGFLGMPRLSWFEDCQVWGATRCVVKG